MLSYRHISHAVEKFINYVDGRRKGVIKSLKTSLPKLNKTTMDGFDWGRITTIAGPSGGGKSLFLEQLKRDFCDLNPDQKFEILSFEFEMLATDQVSRSVSGKLNMYTKSIYSAGEKKVSDNQMEYIENTARGMKKYPIYYVEQSGTPDEIYTTAVEFAATRKLREQNKGLVITIDHTLLTEGKEGQSEQAVVNELCKKTVKLKKYFESINVNCMIIMLSQLNRDATSSERISNPTFHFPTRNDIFGSSKVFFASDYVFVIMKPLVLEGIEAIGSGYGPSGWPLYNPDNKEQPCIYLHVLKDRFGSNKVLHLLDNFKSSRIDEYVKKSNS